MAPSGVDSMQHMNQVIDIISESYTLGEGNKHVLEFALKRCYKQGNTVPTPL